MATNRPPKKIYKPTPKQLRNVDEMRKAYLEKGKSQELDNVSKLLNAALTQGGSEGTFARAFLNSKNKINVEFNPNQNKEKQNQIEQEIKEALEETNKNAKKAVDAALEAAKKLKQEAREKNKTTESSTNTDEQNTSSGTNPSATASNPSPVRIRKIPTSRGRGKDNIFGAVESVSNVLAAGTEDKIVQGLVRTGFEGIKATGEFLRKRKEKQQLENKLSDQVQDGDRGTGVQASPIRMRGGSKTTTQDTQILMRIDSNTRESVQILKQILANSREEETLKKSNVFDTLENQREEGTGKTTKPGKKVEVEGKNLLSKLTSKFGVGRLGDIITGSLGFMGGLLGGTVLTTVMATMPALLTALGVGGGIFLGIKALKDFGPDLLDGFKDDLTDFMNSIKSIPDTIIDGVKRFFGAVTKEEEARKASENFVGAVQRTDAIRDEMDRIKQQYPEGSPARAEELARQEGFLKKEKDEQIKIIKEKYPNWSAEQISDFVNRTIGRGDKPMTAKELGIEFSPSMDENLFKLEQQDLKEKMKKQGLSDLEIGRVLDKRKRPGQEGFELMESTKQKYGGNFKPAERMTPTSIKETPAMNKLDGSLPSNINPDLAGLMAGIATAETGGITNNKSLLDDSRFIRTTAGSDSSAYGPFQITKGLASGALNNDLFKNDEALQNWVKEKFIPQGREMLNRPYNDPIFGKGGKGILNTEEDKAMYMKMAAALLDDTLKRNNGNIEKAAGEWRFGGGKKDKLRTEDPKYLERVLEGSSNVNAKTDNNMSKGIVAKTSPIENVANTILGNLSNKKDKFLTDMSGKLKNTAGNIVNNIMTNPGGSYANAPQPMNGPRGAVATRNAEPTLVRLSMKNQTFNPT